MQIHVLVASCALLALFLFVSLVVAEGYITEMLGRVLRTIRLPSANKTFIEMPVRLPTNVSLATIRPTVAPAPPSSSSVVSTSVPPVVAPLLCTNISYSTRHAYSGFPASSECRGRSVAFAIMGLIRTFAYREVQDSVLNNLVLAIGKRCLVSFFLLALQDDPRKGYSTVMSMERVTDDFLHALQRFNTATAAFFNGQGKLHSLWGVPWREACKEHLAFRRNERCKVTPTWWAGENLQRWAGQWIKVRASYRMVKAYEQREGHRFDFIIRLRPDVLVLNPAPDVLSIPITKGGISVPLGIVLSTYGINDHIVICPRSSNCAAYFNIIEIYETCNGTFDRGRDDGGELLKLRMKAAGIGINYIALDYIMFRKCPVAAECSERIRFLRPKGPATDDVVKKCQNMTAAVCKNHTLLRILATAHDD